MNGDVIECGGMARPLRVDIEDGWYHVTARGDHRQVIFLTMLAEKVLKTVQM